MSSLKFGTAGIRARINELTPKEAYEITLKLSGYLGKNIALARDARVNGKALFDGVEAALLYTGKTVYDLSLCPTPTAQLYLEKTKKDNAFVITASHNPPEWNGIKVFRKDNITLPKEEGNKMLENPKIEAYNPSNNVIREDPSPLHIKELLRFEVEELNAIIDYGNGVAPIIFSPYLEKAGLKAKEINKKIDGTFPGRNSEPIPKNLGEMLSFMEKESYDIGIAFDGDADRVVFFDEKLNFISGDKTLAIVSKYILEKKKGIIVSTVATSRVVDEVVNSMHGKVIHTKVGTTYIAQAIKENNAILGGEEAGGVIYPEVHLGKDGLLTAVLMLHILKEKKTSLHELSKSLPYYYFEKRKISISEEAKKTFMDKFIPHLKELYPEAKFNEADGIRVDFEDSWILVRPSGTENKLRYFVEAKTKEKALSIIEELEKEIVKFTQ